MVAIYPTLLPATLVATRHTWLQSTLRYCQLSRLPRGILGCNLHLSPILLPAILLPPGILGCNLLYLNASYSGCHVANVFTIYPTLLPATQVAICPFFSASRPPVMGHSRSSAPFSLRTNGKGKRNNVQELLFSPLTQTSTMLGFKYIPMELITKLVDPWVCRNKIY